MIANFFQSLCTHAVEQEIVQWMRQRMAALQPADRLYWRMILAELRRLRVADQLLPERSLV